MKYAYLYIITFILLGGFVFNSCRAKKNIQRDERTDAYYERSEQIKDTIRIEIESAESSERSGYEIDQSFTRVTDYDSTGTVRRVQETWRDRQRINVANEERSGRTVSITNREQQIITRDTTSTVASEVIEVNTDSRPIQGIEWVWVILSVAIIATIVIYIIYNRFK